MCGRFALFSTEEALAAAFGLEAMPELAGRYNISPSQEILTVRVEQGRMVAEQLRWGLVPFWAKDPAIGQRMINARAETVADKPSFRQALRRRRCLIPADGFFEWKKAADGGKQPWYISAADSHLLAFAGLWEAWQDPDGDLLRTCTIITATANDLMRDLHHRMPVLVAHSDYGTWLNPEASVAETDSLIAMQPHTRLQAWPVSHRVNNPVNDEPELIRQQE